MTDTMYSVLRKTRLFLTQTDTNYVDSLPQVLATHPVIGKYEGVAEQLALAHEVEVREKKLEG